MPKYLIIAEKPSLSRDIQTAYNSLKSPAFEADFIPLRGHFMELQEPDAYKKEWGKPYVKDVLPMIPDKFTYKIKNGVGADYSKIKSLLTSGLYDCVVNACDAGREGEAIFWCLYNHMGIKLPVKRLWASDTMVETLADALQNLFDYTPGSMFSSLKDSSLCRQEFDWMIGMNLSRAAMLSTNQAVSVGRVKTPTLNIVVMRDKEILNFKPKDFFELDADFNDYHGLWFNGNKTSFDTKAEAEAVSKKLGKTGKIVDVKEDKITNFAPPLYSLTELQKEANRIYGYTAAETLDIAQILYEKYKILSYPRTEARVLSTNVGKEIPKLLTAIKDIPEISKEVALILKEPARITAVCGNKKYVDNKKVTDHHALVNTKTIPDLSKLSDKESKVFMLVIKKFVSIFLDPQILAKSTIITDIDGETFRSTGTVTIQPGYSDLWKSASKDETELPKVTIGDTRTVKNIKLSGKQTQPPKPYTDSSLLDAMQHAGKFVDSEDMKDILDDTKGIGTSATRAAIIDGLISKAFLFRKGKTVRATDFGIQSIDNLSGKDIISPLLTAVWEEKLRNIEDGKITDDDFRKEASDFVTTETESFLNTLTAMDNRPVVGVCPICGKNIVETKKYYLCEQYKKDENPCTFACGKVILGQNISPAEIKAILNHETTKPKKFKKQDGKIFTAGLTLNNDTKNVSFAFTSGNVIGKCPKCKKDIIDKGGSYGCEDTACGFFIAKTLKGAQITETDAVNLISGKSTASKKFFKGKKPWYAKLKYSDDFSSLNFEFQKDK